MSDSLSFNKARWDLPDVDSHLIEQIVRQNDIPEVAARMLAGRSSGRSDTAGGSATAGKASADSAEVTKKRLEIL